MEIPTKVLICTGQILALWMPIVLSGCLQDMQGLSLGNVQSIVPLKNAMDKSCKALSDGDTEECSSECDDKVRDIMNLFETYFTCDCSDLVDSHFYPKDECLAARERLGVCSTLQEFLIETTQQTSTTATLFEEGKIPCVRAHEHCLEESNCKVRLETTISTCATGCSEDCKRTVDALLTLRHAQSLWGCTGCSDGEDGNWCNWSRRCMDAGTLDIYKPGMGQSSTAKTTGTQGGKAGKSVGGAGNGAEPTGALFVSSIGLYMILCVSLSNLFV